jgi:hypothetical protein
LTHVQAPIQKNQRMTMHIGGHVNMLTLVDKSTRRLCSVT